MFSYFCWKFKKFNFENYQQKPIEGDNGKQKETQNKIHTHWS